MMALTPAECASLCVLLEKYNNSLPSVDDFIVILYGSVWNLGVALLVESGVSSLGAASKIFYDMCNSEKTK